MKNTSTRKTVMITLTNRAQATDEFLKFLQFRLGIKLNDYMLKDAISKHLDSLEHVQLIMDAEQWFGVTILEEKANSAATFADLITIICQLKNIKP